MSALKKTFDGMKIGAIIIGAILNIGFLANLSSIIEESGLIWAIVTGAVILTYDIGIVIHTVWTYNNFKK